MSVGPLGNTHSLSGTQQDVSNQGRRNQSVEKAQRAEGLGPADAEQEASDRDADGRRLWEIAQPPADEDDESSTETSDPQTPRSADPTGSKGNLLDLDG